MIAAGTPVCDRAFREFFRVSDSLIFSCKGTEKAPASRSATRCPVEKTRDSPKRDRAIGSLQHYQDTFAQHMPNSDDKYLYLKNKNELFDEYESQTRKELHGELVGLDAALCTREYFIRIWAQEFPHLKLKPSADFMLCKICTLLKSAIFGTQSGSRGIQEEEEKEEEEEEDLELTKEGDTMQHQKNISKNDRLLHGWRGERSTDGGSADQRARTYST